MPNLAKISTLTPEQAATFAERIVSGNRAAIALPMATEQQVADAATAIYCQSNPAHPGVSSDVWGGHAGSDARGLNTILLALVGFRVPTKLIQAELAKRAFLKPGGAYGPGGANIANCLKDRAKLKHANGWPVATYGGSEWCACNPEWHMAYFGSKVETVVNRDTLTIEMAIDWFHPNNLAEAFSNLRTGSGASHLSAEYAATLLTRYAGRLPAKTVTALENLIAMGGQFAHLVATPVLLPVVAPVVAPAAAPAVKSADSMTQAKGLGKAAKSAAKRQGKPQTARQLEASLAATPADNASAATIVANRKSGK